MLFEEDEYPTVEPVKGVKYKGTRYNSEKGFIYHLQKRTSTFVIYHCKYHKKKNGGCKARIKSEMESGMFIRHGTNHHNHPPETEEQKLLTVLHPGVPIGYGDAMQRRLQRAKRRRQPPIPATVEEIVHLIEEYPEYRDAFEGGQFYWGHVKVADGEEALVFLSPKLLPKLSEATEIQADATFRNLPGLFKQLFTLHITKFNLVFSFAYVLMTRKTRALYDLVMERIIDVFDKVHPNRFIGVDLVMSYYESAIQGSLTAALHGSQAVGCFFHYSQHDARSRMDPNDSSNNGIPDQERPAVRPRRRFLAGSVREVLPPPPPYEVRQPAAEVQQPNAEDQQPAAEVQTRPVRRRNLSRVARIICQMMGILQLQGLLADVVLIPDLKLKMFFCVLIIVLFYLFF
ncbi:hypothetical protein GHT06_013494 [Daphnia sinensis]|uniref:FLYWCH-type domain-containing protein n=1 Tax=Daphnia sinensis TaxID=1820382 RepID=A0AAD5PXZ9_9CRUS|nr:hypothetical protein GHT06_013494 [Daphnia sinensis]